MGAPVVRLVAIVNVPMPGGENIIVQRSCKLDTSPAAMPAAFFVHHIIDEDSPFYVPETDCNPTCCSFENCLALSIGVRGQLRDSQQMSAGMGTLDKTDIQVD